MVRVEVVHADWLNKHDVLLTIKDGNILIKDVRVGRGDVPEAEVHLPSGVDLSEEQAARIEKAALAYYWDVDID